MQKGDFDDPAESKPLVAVIARPGGLLPGEAALVDLTPGDLVWESYDRNYGQLQKDCGTCPGAHSLSGSAWRVFCLIVVDGSPSHTNPFRLVLYTDADIARTLPGMTRATVTKARKTLCELGFVRVVRTRAGGYIWILREPSFVPNGT